jgi:CheY-like chemotaxis protein
MNDGARRLIFRYGIAAALVVLATGVALLVPALPLLIVYLPVVAVAAWKGDWRAGVTATLLSSLAAGFLSGSSVSELVAFTAAGLAVCAIVRAFETRAVQLAVAGSGLAPMPISLPPPPAALAADERERESEARRAVQATLEAAAREQLEILKKQRLKEEEASDTALQELEQCLAQVQSVCDRGAAEAEVFARSLEERLAEERENARRQLDERIAAERASLRQRIEAELAAEREAMQRKADEVLTERLRFAKELAAERLAMEREAAQHLVARQQALKAELTAPRVTIPAPVPPPLPAAKTEPVKDDDGDRRRRARQKSGTRPKARPAVDATATEQYEVGCYTCGDLFDAASAEWCSCLGTDRSVVCTHCSTCFCKSTDVYKGRFWKNAPAILFQRKLTALKRPADRDEYAIPERLKRPLVLLVEDDPNVRLIVRRVVTSMGYGFIVAANGQEGLAMAQRYNPELIVTDAFMPKLDGREMCRLLKEDPATAHMNVILMTGVYTSRKYRKEAMERFKVDHYLAKPVSVDDLIELFHKYLAERALNPA